MNDDDDVERPAAAPAPSWIVTFADLMSLLMCFFVLLLTFSEMDAQKFRAIAESLQATLGPGNVRVVTQQVPLSEISPVPVVVLPASPPEPVAEPVEDAIANARATEQQHTEDLAQNLAEALTGEIARNEIELVAKGRTVTLRIREQGSFGSGSDAMNPAYRPVIARIAELLIATDAQIQVSGHTDDQPIETDRFRSNWELSSARAVSVAHQLLADKRLPPARIAVSGHADTRPLGPNDSAAARARNRRVEILIIRSDLPPRS